MAIDSGAPPPRIDCRSRLPAYAKLTWNPRPPSPRVSAGVSAAGEHEAGAVGKCRLVGGHAVVRAGPRREVQHARFPLGPPVCEPCQEPRDHVVRKLAPKELRLGVRVARLALDRPSLTGVDVVLGEVAL